ncbi:hypothetical protein L198_02110 [Cryptococcus wingfieldii CBS 7118]|uniref:Uncharacterized protein n=1 Tax=Cryptococcus wingfieldii CBS 7118 TaxID=1295528 RepID=A0A1E3JYX7_9TREE|nr:hypothetical protein L198_02110 [Cryptococcus wingfieldii CBS 7118]ODO05417.1 hypothetical protein L198_02110 [Cryptococcus wingfieldii CBS 7118]
MAESTGTASGSSNTDRQGFTTIDFTVTSHTEWTQFELTVGDKTRRIFTYGDKDVQTFRSEVARRIEGLKWCDSSMMAQPLDAVSATKVASYKADFVQGRWGAEYFGNETAQGRTTMCSSPSSRHELEDGSGRRCPLGSVPDELVTHLQAEKGMLEGKQWFRE